jgi:hypothetical protein
MATVTETRPASKPTRTPPTAAEIIERTPVVPATVDPWYEDRRPAYAVPADDLTFGKRVRHVSRPGTWKIVRAAERRDSASRYHVRVREQAADGSLVGAVESWTLDQVAAIVGDEPKAEVKKTDEIVSPVSSPPTADEPRPLTVAMVISIDHVHYVVAPLAPAPDAVKAYRFTKVDGDEAQHDLDETADGASCTCGDFVWRHEGRDDLGCRHIRAARMLGLIAEALEPTPARTAYDDAREKLARIAEDEAVIRSEGIISTDTPARVAAVPATCCPDDEPLPCAACVTHEGPADLSDDDWQDGYVWSIGSGPDGSPDADDAWTDPVDMRTWDPALDAEDDGPADERMTLDSIDGHSEPEPARRPLAAQIDVEAVHYRTLGTAFGDLIAETLAKLAAEVRYLDAATPDAYRDRREAALDAARDAAEARQRAACC